MSESQMRLTLTCSRQWVRVLRLAPRAAMTIWTTLRTPVMPNQMKVPNQARNHQSCVSIRQMQALNCCVIRDHSPGIMVVISTRLNSSFFRGNSKNTNP